MDPRNEIDIVSSLGLDLHPGDWYYIPVCGLLAKELLDHKAWWTPLVDGKMVLHVLMCNACLSVDLSQ
jgi:hypothetical protein